MNRKFIPTLDLLSFFLAITLTTLQTSSDDHSYIIEYSTNDPNIVTERVFFKIVNTDGALKGWTETPSRLTQWLYSADVVASYINHINIIRSVRSANPQEKNIVFIDNENYFRKECVHTFYRTSKMRK